MEFRHLQTFQAIVREGSFLKAAEKLQYAQSTITLHIQQLEAELGVKLFARRGKRTELTVAGRTLQEHVDYLLYRAENLMQTMTDLIAGEAGHIRIGSIEPVASVHLPALLARFCHQHPKVRLTLETGVTQSLGLRVATGLLDVAICSPPHANLNLAFEFLFEDPIALLVPKTHQLAKSHRISVDALNGERLILTEEHCPYRGMLEKALLARGINPFSGIEVMSLEALKQMVRCDLGIGVIPAAAATPNSNAIARNISDLELKLPIGIIFHSEASFPGSTLHSFISELRTSLKSPDLIQSASSI